jgi:hypothetical protein
MMYREKFLRRFIWNKHACVEYALAVPKIEVSIP